jgi:hypothetical protein
MSQLKTCQFFLHTNIPDVDPVSFTKEMIYGTKLTPTEMNGFSKYPFISSTNMLPKNQLLNLSREDQIRYFFSKTKHKEFSKNYPSVNRNTDILEYNVIAALEILFPTVYPLKSNNNVSYKTHIKKEKEMRITLKGIIPSFRQDYTYLKIKDKVYTVTGTTLLNDVVNHPLYKNMFSQYEKYKAEENLKKIEIDKKLIVLNESISNELNENPKVFCDLKEELEKFAENLKYSRGNELEANINTLIRILTNICSDENHTERVISKINENAELLRSVVENNSAISNSIKSVVRNIVTASQRINVLKFVENNYFGKNSMFLENKKDGNEDKDKDKDKLLREANKYIEEFFPTYRKFYEEIRQFIHKRKCSNKKLQDKINVFDLYDLHEAIKENKLQSNDYARVGITKLEKTAKDGDEPEYEAYVYVTCIGGQLTDAVKKRVSCMFKNHDLGKRLKDLFLDGKKKSTEIEIGSGVPYVDFEAEISKDSQTTSSPYFSSLIKWLSPKDTTVIERDKTPMKGAGTRTRTRTRTGTGTGKKIQYKHYMTRKFYPKRKRHSMKRRVRRL